jgi:hypothetical protein
MRFNTALLRCACVWFVLVTQFQSFASAADSLQQITAILQDGQLKVSAKATGPIWDNSQLLIDLTGDSKTGYKLADVSDHAFEFMVEGTTLYHFKGSDQTAWSWEKAKTATRQVDGASIHVSIDLKSFGDKPKISAATTVVLRALSADYQKVLAASSLTAVHDAGESEEHAELTSSVSAEFKQNESDLVIQVKVAKVADIDTLLIFFDTDCDAATGFNPPADPHFGFEYMIQGESLLLHTGEARDGWNWKTVGPLERTASGTSVEFKFNAALLKSQKFNAAVWQMSPDWQTRTTRYPADDKGTVQVTLDLTKVHAQAERQPLPFAEARADRDLPARQRFAKAASYCCYYGAAETSDLSHYDAVILHTPAQTATDVKRLNDLGVVTIGYLSVGEDDQLQVGNGQGPGGKASWYFNKHNSNEPDKNGIWSSWYANAGDPLWRANRVAEARRLCNEVGFAGIFLDTVETCDSYPQSREGMIQLICDLRSALPDKVIVMNRGFSLLKESRVSSKIDGLMFESFTDSYDWDTKSYIEFMPADLDSTRGTMERDVLPASKIFPLRVLALDYCQPDQSDRIQRAFDRAATFGMVPAVAPIFLDDVYDTTHVKGKPNDKYLSKLATPQSLGITLRSDRNGFPTGTRIEPSSCFLGYSVNAIVDGIQDRTSLPWAKAAWASAEEPSRPQQLEFIFPQAVPGSTLHINFAFDDSKWRTSKNLLVQTQQSDDSPWMDQPIAITMQTAQAKLPGNIRRLRIVQPAGQGCADRPDLMWIAQVAIAR